MRDAGEVSLGGREPCLVTHEYSLAHASWIHKRLLVDSQTSVASDICLFCAWFALSIATGMQPLSERPAPLEVGVPKFVKFRQEKEQRERASAFVLTHSASRVIQNRTRRRVTNLAIYTRYSSTIRTKSSCPVCSAAGCLCSRVFFTFWESDFASIQ